MRQSDGIERRSWGAQGPYWIIRRGRQLKDPGQGLLTLELAGLGRILPVFGSKQGTLGFLRGLSGEEPHSLLEAAYICRLKLISELCSTLSGVDRVAFDPLPEPDLVDTVVLASLSSRSFVDLVLGRDKAWAARSGRDGAFRT